MALARLENACVRYGRKTVLRDVNLAIDEGDFVGLIGPNGSGKSTLMGLFNGMTPLASGAVYFDRTRLTRSSLREVRSRIAHVFQMIELDSKIPISVFETVLSGTYGQLGLFRRPGDKERATARECLQAVEMSDLADRPLGELSGGQQQRVAIARALAQQPQFLMLDEPTSALDWQVQRALLVLIDALRRRYHLSVLMATHDLNAVLSLCNKAVLLKEGSVVAAGPVDEVISAASLSALFDADIMVETVHDRRVVLF